MIQIIETVGQMKELLDGYGDDVPFRILIRGISGQERQRTVRHLEDGDTDGDYCIEAVIDA